MVAKARDLVAAYTKVSGAIYLNMMYVRPVTTRWACPLEMRRVHTLRHQRYECWRRSSNGNPLDWSVLERKIALCFPSCSVSCSTLHIRLSLPFSNTFRR